MDEVGYAIMGPRFGFGIIEGIILAVLLINLIAIVFIALYARKKKGYSFWLFLLLGLFSSCVIQGVLALLLPNKRTTASQTAYSNPNDGLTG
jgi:cbb3-type cytochrome oxidase subunit 3